MSLGHSLQRVHSILNYIKKLLELGFLPTQIGDNIAIATDVVILLTKNLLNNGSESLREMMIAFTELKPSMLTFVYLNDESEDQWDWTAPSKVSISDFFICRDLISGQDFKILISGVDF